VREFKGQELGGSLVAIFSVDFFYSFLCEVSIVMNSVSEGFKTFLLCLGARNTPFI